MSLFDLLMAPCWLVATALLLRAAARVSARLHARGDFFEWALDSLVLSWATIVVTAFGLGLCRLLVANLLLAVVAALSAATLWALREKTRGASGDAYATKSDASGDAYATAADFLSAAPLFDGSIRRRDRAWFIGWLAYGSLAAAAIALCGLLEFPTDWDSLAYHIPLVDQWIRARSLNSMHSSSWFHPGNDELLGFWCVAPFSGDFLIALENIPAVAILGLAVHELARRLGAGRAAAHLAALAALTPHVVLRQLVDGENDVAVAGLFVAALAFGVRYAHVPRAGNAFLWAMAFGLLPGVKYYALGYAAVAAVGIAALTLRLRGPRRAAASAFAALAGAALLSGYWYARNASLTGTPLYPQGFLWNPGVLAEIFPYLRETSLLGKRDPTLAPLLALAVWKWLGAAHWAAFLTVPLTSLMLVRGVFRRGDARRASSRAMLAGLLWLTLGVFGTTPFVVETAPGTLDMLKQGYLPSRFLLCTATLAELALVTVIDRSALTRSGRRAPFCSERPPWRSVGGGATSVGSSLNAAESVPSRIFVDSKRLRGPRWRRAALCLFAAAAAWQPRLSRLGSGSGDPWTIALAGFDVFLLLVLCGEIRRAWHSPRFAALSRLSGAILVSLAIWGLATRWHCGFAEFYDRYYGARIFSQLQTDAVKAQRICPLTYRSYPFLGSRRQYEVLGPDWAPTFDALREYLLTARPDTVVAVRQEIVGPHRYDRIRDWVTEHEDLFKPIHADPRFAVYRFTP